MAVLHRSWGTLGSVGWFIVFGMSCGVFRWGALNHEDVMKVGQLGIMPRYIGEFGEYCWVDIEIYEGYLMTAPLKSPLYMLEGHGIALITLLTPQTSRSESKPRRIKSLLRWHQTRNAFFRSVFLAILFPITLFISTANSATAVSVETQRHIDRLQEINDAIDTLSTAINNGGQYLLDKPYEDICDLLATQKKGVFWDEIKKAVEYQQFDCSPFERYYSGKPYAYGGNDIAALSDDIVCLFATYSSWSSIRRFRTPFIYESINRNLACTEKTSAPLIIDGRVLSQKEVFDLNSVMCTFFNLDSSLSDTGFINCSISTHQAWLDGERDSAAIVSECFNFIEFEKVSDATSFRTKRNCKSLSTNKVQGKPSGKRTITFVKDRPSATDSRPSRLLNESSGISYNRLGNVFLNDSTNPKEGNYYLYGNTLQGDNGDQCVLIGNTYECY
jgi:hypothetical protein